ncbi:MAG: recombinase family protein [Ruminococcus sp.]|nr:recombinase family protein [Ruminococcus sp.]
MSFETQITALYCGVSQEDNNVFDESVSIKTQKIMLEKYAIEHGYYQYKFYVDNGYSDMDFNRSGFQKMIHDIESGIVERVIVKDLSRLGKNYILTHEYIGFLFAEYGIHFISITENINSEIMPSDNITADNNTDRIILPDTHYSIVSAEVLENAQKISCDRKRIITVNNTYSEPVFQDIIFCADCGKPMYFMHKAGERSDSGFYICNTKRKNNNLCSLHYIRKSEIISLIVDDIKNYICCLIKDENRFRNNLIRTVKRKNSLILSQARSRQKSIDSRISEIYEILRRVSGGITEDFDSEIKNLKSEHDYIVRKIKEIGDGINEVEIFMDSLKRYRNCTELNISMVEDLIERIDVLNPQTACKRTGYRKISVTYAGIGKIDDNF